MHDDDKFSLLESNVCFTFEFIDIKASTFNSNESLFLIHECSCQWELTLVPVAASPLFQKLTYV